jgi:hypothetical protein
LGSTGKLFWLTGAISSSQHSDLFQFLRQRLRVPEINTESLLAALTTEILEKQSDAWLSGFYGLLLETPALYRAPRFAGDLPGPARSKPIIRLEDGSHIAPFKRDGTPAVYLPRADVRTRFPVVKQSVTALQTSRQFLEHLGLREPDTAAEVLTYTLPRYGPNNTTLPSDEIIQQDLPLIEQALAPSGETSRRVHLVLSNLPFIRCTSATGRRAMQRPSACYFATGDLMAYFADNPNAWFVDEVYQPWRPLLRRTGVQADVRVSTRRTGNQHVTLRASRGDHARGLHGFDNDFDFDGLDWALNHPTPKRSSFVWNELLVPNASLLLGTVEASTRKDFSDAIRKANVPSKALIKIRKSTWLPDPQDGWCKPSKIGMHDLPEDYQRDEQVAHVLEMADDKLRKVSKQLNVRADHLQFLMSHPDQIERLMRAQQPATITTGGLAGAVPGPRQTFGEAVAGTLDRPGNAAVPEPAPVVGTGRVANPELRTRRLEEDIREEMAHDVGRVRFTIAPRRVWEARDSDVRAFLLAQFGGRCQICKDSFNRRDGEPYFDALHLARRSVGRHTDRPGAMLCLCPTCCARLLHGSVEGEDIPQQVQRLSTARSIDGTRQLRLILCGRPTTVTYTEKHLLELKALLAVDG